MRHSYLSIALVRCYKHDHPKSIGAKPAQSGVACGSNPTISVSVTVGGDEVSNAPARSSDKPSRGRGRGRGGRGAAEAGGGRGAKGGRGRGGRGTTDRRGRLPYLCM